MTTLAPMDVIRQVAQRTETHGHAHAPTSLQSPVAARICSRGLRAAVALALAASTAQLLELTVLGGRARMLDMDTHASLFGAVSLLALVAACCAAALVAATRAAGRMCRLLPPLLAALLALRVLHPDDVFLIALPAVAATFTTLWWHAGAPGSDVRRVIRIGCAALVVSYLVHAFGPHLVSASGDRQEAWPSEVERLIGHGAELAGWVAVASGLAAAVAASGRARSPWS